MRVAFTKMHGLGNDFIICDAPGEGFVPSAGLWQRLAARRTGIGFDQALLLEPPRSAGTAAYYRIFNSDGGEAEQSGNGARCIAAYLRTRGAMQNGTLKIESTAGLVEARAASGDLIAIDLGVPDFAPAALHFEALARSDYYRLHLNGEEIEIGAVSIGNPHAVLAVGDVATAPVQRLGPAVEHHPRFAHGVNVGFMQTESRACLRLRVYERGAGETLACGTGACAAVAVGRARGELDAEVQVVVRGGELRVNWEGPGQHIWLTGPAEMSFAGYFEV